MQESKIMVEVKLILFLFIVMKQFSCNPLNLVILFISALKSVSVSSFFAFLLILWWFLKTKSIFKTANSYKVTDNQQWLKSIYHQGSSLLSRARTSQRTRPRICHRITLLRTLSGIMTFPSIPSLTTGLYSPTILF